MKSRNNLCFWDCHVAIAARNDSSTRTLVNIYKQTPSSYTTGVFEEGEGSNEEERDLFRVSNDVDTGDGGKYGSSTAKARECD